jgi:hypothetical protein
MEEGNSLGQGEDTPHRTFLKLLDGGETLFFFLAELVESSSLLSCLTSKPRTIKLG